MRKQKPATSFQIQRDNGIGTGLNLFSFPFASLALEKSESFGKG